MLTVGLGLRAAGRGPTVQGVAVKLFLDDERDPCEVPDLGDPDQWLTVRDALTCIAVLGCGGVAELSLDHDLGTEETGYTVALWLEQALHDGLPVPQRVYLHTANPVGRGRMRSALRAFPDVRVAYPSGRKFCADT